MNYPNATASDWTYAQAIIRRHLTAHGLPASDADDIVQAWATKALTQAHAQRCPRTPAHAARGYVRLCRRLGVPHLMSGAAHARKARREGAEPIPVYTPARQAGPDAVASIVERVAGGYAATEYSRRRRDSRAAVARDSITGGEWEPGDAVERFASTPTDYGSAYTPPQQGCPGLHTDTDPRPTWHRHTPQPLTGEALDAYRAALADHYASR